MFARTWDAEGRNMKSVIPRHFALVLALFASFPWPVAQAQPAPNPAKRIVVWDGEAFTSGGGWVNPTTSTFQPQTAQAHSGPAALEFKFKANAAWIGAGWNWFNFKKGTDIGTDASQLTTLSFWIKTKGVTGDLQLNLLSNGDILDTPEEHSQRVHVLKYCPKFEDGNWHEVAIPLADLIKPGFNPKIISELHLGLTPTPGQESDGSIFLDDIASDNRKIAIQ